MDSKQIEEWKNNFDNYISASDADDIMEYYMQPVEQDARGYADTESEQYSKYRSNSEMPSKTGRWERSESKSDSTSTSKIPNSHQSKGNSHNKR